jgi:hypothetical protein
MHPPSPVPAGPADRGHHSAVVALAIVRGADIPSKDAEILLAIRHPDSNPTHPNVVSVPTMRVPPVLLQSLTQTLDVLETRPGGACFYRLPEVRSDRDNGHHPIVFIVEAILAGKLGMAEWLERGRLVFASRLFSVTTGLAHYATDNPYGDSELIAMGNILLTVPEGFELFPKANASYSEIFPATLAQLEHAKATGQVSGLPLRLNPAIHQIGGLCIESTVNVIRHLFP